jgi:prephenate dehydrogenase
MASSAQRITIVGTGCIGASMGLAIRQSQDADHLEVVGHDRDPALARRAQRLGAFDSVSFNLDVALRDAKLVILAVPLAALREVLQDVGRLLEPNSGVVVTSTTHLIAPAIGWAAEALPEGAYYVGGDPFLAPDRGGWEPLRGLVSAAADLFQEAVYAIAPDDDVHPSAVRAVTNLALALGATPRYMDPTEHDGVRALAATVPTLLATGLFQATVGLPGWAEVRRAAGRDFATATSAASGDIASRRMAALLARETVLLGLDEVLARLQTLRAAVAEGDAEALEDALAEAARGRAAWMLQSQARVWELTPESASQGGLFDRTLQMLLGEGLAKRPRPDRDLEP